MAKVELEWEPKEFGNRGSATYGPFKAIVYAVPGTDQYFLSVSFSTVQIYNASAPTEEHAKAIAERYIAKHVAAIQALRRVES